MASTRSTKTRLTFYFTALFGAIVICLALASYLVVTRAGYSDLDSSLHVAVVATAMSAQHEIAEHPEQRDGEADLQSILVESLSSALPDTQILIREGERTVAYKSSQPGNLDLRTVSSRQLDSQSEWRGQRIASQILPLSRFHTAYRIYAAASLKPVLARLAFFRRMLLVCVPLGLALAAFAGYLLARRALAPLNELTRTIEAVTTSDLSARVPVDQPGSDLGRLATRFNVLLDRLEGAFKAQRQFMADASHELRTPLTVALTTAQVTARDGKRSIQSCNESLSLVEAQLLRLRRIIDNLLFLSQADATSLEIERREFFLDDVISDAVRSANVLARAKRQTVRIERLTEARCLGDEELLRQALLILLENAVKYTQEAGRISITLDASGDDWRCRVGNNGPAIPAAVQPHIFERFYRGQNTGSERTSGSGLGLAIAKSIAETHDGSLALIASEPGSTVFELRIPASISTSEDRYQAKSFAVNM